ncbi:hypothetical protein R8Z50_11250 [Longispora sp. K20-0274]|uniref:hypothetical protein n=1 Tax=Longispora sp. K20-0274 TaxID=3088255 RepID=UPI00399B1E18
MVETGEATTAANPAYLEYDFGRNHSGLKFTIQQDAAGIYRITAWKVQYLNPSGTWTDVMPYQTIGSSAQATYTAPATVPPTSKIRLYVQNSNANEYPAVQEFRVTGQPS